MSYVSIGDLALSFLNQRANVQIKSDLARLTQELASGRKSDLSTAIAGDFAPIVGIERALQTKLAFATSTTEAGLFSASMQASLEIVQNQTSALAPSLLIASSSASRLTIQTATSDAVNKFDAVIAAFNTRVADRYAFSGAATDRPALANADIIIAALQTAIAAETTAVGIETVVDAWFDDVGGGFETIGYIGSNTTLAPFRLSETAATTIDLTAADPAIRSVLKGFALAVLISDGALVNDISGQAELAGIAGEKLLNSEYALTILRANVGSAEARIEDATVQNSAEKYALEIARAKITAIDPYRTATELEAVALQLETLYTLTIRLSRLSLSEYLR